MGQSNASVENLQDQSIDVTFNNTGLNQRPRDELYVCLWPACKARCKRIYDLKRHYTAVHNREGGLGYFCPVDGCNWSNLPLDTSSLWYNPSHYGAETLHPPATGNRVLALRGFARKDKWLRHLKREHKDKFKEDNQVLLEECEPCGQILLEVKEFKPNWNDLGRVRHDDGTWSNWYGDDYDSVVAAGFKTYDLTPFDPKSTAGPDLSFLLNAKRSSSAGQLNSPSSSTSTSEGQSTSADGETALPSPLTVDPSRALSEAQIWRNYATYTGHSSFNHSDGMGTGQNFSSRYF